MARSLCWLSLLLLTGCAATQDSFCRLIEPDSYFLVSVGRCETVEMAFDYDPEADFSVLNGYDWLAAQSVSFGETAAPEDKTLHQWVSEAVDAGLAEQGFERDHATPDFLVDYHAAVESQARLTLKIVRADDRVVIWQGTADDLAYPARNPEGQQERIEMAVTRLLAQFPPSKGK